VRGGHLVGAVLNEHCPGLILRLQQLQIGERDVAGKTALMELRPASQQSGHEGYSMLDPMLRVTLLQAGRVGCILLRNRAHDK